MCIYLLPTGNPITPELIAGYAYFTCAKATFYKILNFTDSNALSPVKSDRVWKDGFGSFTGKVVGVSSILKIIQIFSLLF